MMLTSQLLESLITYKLTLFPLKKKIPRWSESKNKQKSLLLQTPPLIILNKFFKNIGFNGLLNSSPALGVSIISLYEKTKCFHSAWPGRMSEQVQLE